MADSEDLINFDVIEGQKENIQALPSGRSAKKLADLFSPSPLHKLATPTPSDTKNINDCIRAEYEAEVTNLSESDDPLDVFDRYVRWTFDAYPSAQATPQSQLHTLLERATKAFIGSPQYRNDPRYLKLWLHYIHFFADAPRETYLYLSRHGIGDGLALFYEEYAEWLEGAGRWTQSEEVYKLGIEREARPQQRLLRKFAEFEQRRARHDEAPDEPTSPALPTMRPALAAKVDPFAAAARAADPQAPRRAGGVGGQGQGQASRPGRAKLQIFSDAEAAAPAGSGREAGSKGWESIGSLAERKKENVVEPKPWVGETMKAGGKKSSAPKMAIFRDAFKAQLSKSHIVIEASKQQVTVHPQSGKRERIAFDLQAVYPTPEEPGSELSFEEILLARHRIVEEEEEEVMGVEEEPAMTPPRAFRREEPQLVKLNDMDENDENAPPRKLGIYRDPAMLDENGAPLKPAKTGKSKKKKVMEVNETQIIKAKLDSPSGPKIRKKSAEPTMTIHTKAATDEIYDIFNQPVKAPVEDVDDESGDEDYETDSNYTSGVESTGTTRNITTSEAGDEEDEGDVVVEDETSDVKSVSEWSDFSAGKHIPHVEGGGEPDETEEVSDLIDAHDSELSDPISDHSGPPEDDDYDEGAEDDLTTPVAEDFPPRTRTVFVPIPPEDYEPPTRPYRDPAEVANNRLPFMTPITERTESSVGVEDENNEQYYHTKTPCKKDDVPPHPDEDLPDEPLSSPLREIVNESKPMPRIAQPLLQKAKPAVAQPSTRKPLAPKGPIIKDAQCNPVDESIREEILANMQPPLRAYEGFYDHRGEKYEKGAEIRKFAKAASKATKNGDRSSSAGLGVSISFPDVKASYTLRKELGAGAFAPVYLVENSAAEEADESEGSDEEGEDEVAAMGKGAFALAHHRRGALEALKMEDPPTAWEFHMMRLAHARLGPQHRATASLSAALELHLYADEGFLFLPYHAHGTLLDVVNLFRAEPSGVMDETLAMFFTVELLRTVEALHGRGLLHGDLKADNCLLRLDAPAAAAPGEPQQLSSGWRADGGGGWDKRGVVLIDFGRGIDMRAFGPEVAFIADWRTTAQDCAEMREGRPWTWQIDYHGLAGIVHCLLFGRYIETARADAGGLGVGVGVGSARRYRVRESLKRYWQTDIWADCFDLLLNPGTRAEGEEGGRMPVLRGMRAVRERMEAWLEGNCERGVGLRGLMAKVEGWARGRR